MKNMKGMSAFVTVVLSLVVIIIILFSSFGPGGLAKLANKMFFDNDKIIPKDNLIYEDETGVVVGDSSIKHLGWIKITPNLEISEDQDAYRVTAYNKIGKDNIMRVYKYETETPAKVPAYTHISESEQRVLLIKWEGNDPEKEVKFVFEIPYPPQENTLGKYFVIDSYSGDGTFSAISLAENIVKGYYNKGYTEAMRSKIASRKT